MIFVSEIKLDSVQDCCQKKKPFQISGLEPVIVAGRVSDDCILLHLPWRIPIGTVAKNRTGIDPHLLPTIPCASIHISESLYYQRLRSLAISTMFFLRQSQALSALRYVVAITLDRSKLLPDKYCYTCSVTNQDCS